jgi:hypothetical protein
VTLAERVSAISRARKMRLFMEMMQPGPETSVLDVGVDDLGYDEVGEWATANFFEEHYPWPTQVTAVGIHEGVRFQRQYPSIAFVQADGCDLPFADGEFDVCFSNAVVEHVGGRDRQRRFVAEAIRVADRVFLSTPNRHFPIEVHTRLPFVHWLPGTIATRIYDLMGKHWASEFELLSASEFRSLFPEPNRVQIVGLFPTIVAVT